jgi:hypothetical protein
MNTIRTLLFSTLWMGLTFSAFAQNGGRGPMSTTAVGHMAVTLLSPAALTSTRNLEFNDISLNSAEVSTAVADNNISMASVRVSGTYATYSVTVSNKKLGFSQNGKALSVSNFSSVSTMEDAGISNIHIGATMRISTVETAQATEKSSPLAIIINYN